MSLRVLNDIKQLGVIYCALHRGLLGLQTELLLYQSPLLWMTFIISQRKFIETTSFPVKALCQQVPGLPCERRGRSVPCLSWTATHPTPESPLLSYPFSSTEYVDCNFFPIAQNDWNQIQNFHGYLNRLFLTPFWFFPCFLSSPLLDPSCLNYGSFVLYFLKDMLVFPPLLQEFSLCAFRNLCVDILY